MDESQTYLTSKNDGGLSRSYTKTRQLTSVTIWNGYDQAVHIMHNINGIWENCGLIHPDKSIDIQVGMNDLIKVLPESIPANVQTYPIIEIISLLDNSAYCFSPSQISCGKCPDKGLMIVQKVKDQLTQINYGGVDGIVLFGVAAALVIIFIIFLRAWKN